MWFLIIFALGTSQSMTIVQRTKSKSECQSMLKQFQGSKAKTNDIKLVCVEVK